MEKVASVLDVEREIVDSPTRRRMDRIEGRIDLDHVVFAYGDEPVLHGIDLHVPAGGCIALVGESGGGKSAMAKLLRRFYDPGEGAVRVDGLDPRELELGSCPPPLRDALQGPFPFFGAPAEHTPLGPAPR